MIKAITMSLKTNPIPRQWLLFCCSADRNYSFIVPTKISYISKTIQ